MCVLSGHPTVSWRCKRTRNVRGQSRPPGAALLIRSRPRYGTKGTRLAIEHWFDSLNRTLTDEAPRRGLLRSASALLAGLALGAGRAAVARKKKKRGDKKKTITRRAMEMGTAVEAALPAVASQPVPTNGPTTQKIGMPVRRSAGAVASSRSSSSSLQTTTIHTCARPAAKSTSRAARTTVQRPVISV
jgi:hypothetical protein